MVEQIALSTVEITNLKQVTSGVKELMLSSYA